MALAPLPPPEAALLVALGAVPGAWLRFWLVNQLEPRLPRRHWGTFAVNLAACFGLGLLIAAGQHERGFAASALPLLIGTGFLGSISTFSTLAAELEGCLRQGERRQALVLALVSLLGGLLALLAGRGLGGWGA
jgi:CrcB protein